MEITKKNLVLSFETPIKTVLDVVITKPNPELTPQSIKTAMDGVLASQAIGDVALAQSIQGAKYVIQQVDQLDLGL